MKVEFTRPFEVFISGTFHNYEAGDIVNFTEEQAQGMISQNIGILAEPEVNRPLPTQEQELIFEASTEGHQANQFERLKEAELVLIKRFMQQCPKLNPYEVYLGLSNMRQIAISAVAIEICFWERANGHW